MKMIFLNLLFIPRYIIIYTSKQESEGGEQQEGSQASSYSIQVLHQNWPHHHGKLRQNQLCCGMETHQGHAGRISILPKINPTQTIQGHKPSLPKHRSWFLLFRPWQGCEAVKSKGNFPRTWGNMFRSNWPWSPDPSWASHCQQCHCKQIACVFWS